MVHKFLPNCRKEFDYENTPPVNKLVYSHLSNSKLLLGVLFIAVYIWRGKTMKQNLETIIKAAAKQTKADLVIKNGRIIDVFNLEIIEEDIAIKDGMIVGIGKYEGEKVVDADGAFICPGLIDGHVHMESSMIHPYYFTNTILLHGVTTIITDPHEIANVSGTTGIQFMLDATETVPVDVFFMLPSCVPATSFEHNGATVHASDLAPFYTHERVIGLAEVMDFPAVRDRDDAMLAKLSQAILNNKLIDGHGAGLTAEEVTSMRPPTLYRS